MSSAGATITPTFNARPELAPALESASSSILGWINATQLPVVYHEQYNIGFFGIEKLHPMDSCKYGKVVNALVDAKVLTRSQLVTPMEATDEMLSDVHDQKYLQAMRKSKLKIASVVELPPLVMLPNAIVQRNLVRPMTRHVGGTMLAASLAVIHGWAINLGGGMHHAHRENGEGWCPYDDIMLAIRHVRRATGGTVQKVLYVDVDVHQGNGVERDKLHFQDQDLYIVDAYNCRIWPDDTFAKAAINVAVELQPKTTDETYLRRLTEALQQAASEFRPDLLVYNAGTDILAGDPLGNLAVSAEGIQQRDQLVWQFAADQEVPIVMLLSGGYARNNAAIISKSLINLFQKFDLAGTSSSSK